MLLRSTGGANMKTITEKEFINLVDYIKKNFGVDLYQKKSLVTSRLINYLTENNYDSFTHFFDRILADKTGETTTVLMNKLTTNHTYFMRESQHFNIFKSEVLPYLQRTQQAKKDLNIWSAGCSSGEEPYTLAMIIADYFGINKKEWDTRILATDISTQVLEKAVNGIYKKEEIETLPKKWQSTYFKKQSRGDYKIIQNINNEVIFKRFNLMGHRFPFKRKFHVIFCRNVMIYFDAETKKELVNRFYEYTEDGGYLFIGHSESLSREESQYNYVMPAVYRK
ncbi:MAG: methyltransferase, CheR-type [Eubacterium sp.]|jgi:chemotaxis protein methyltransferase CheR|nr:methyltransferase, CheR-type [Eubacterium sp.]